MRDEVLAGLVDKAMTDADFRRNAITDLEGTLAAHGYELQADELEAVRELHGQVAGKSEAEVEQLLAGNATKRQQGG
jgi:F0F1-type ATP synthase membrane subunit b/b'